MPAFPRSSLVAPRRDAVGAPPRMRGSRLITRGSLKVLLPAAGLMVLLGGGGFAALETDAVVGSYWEGVWWALSLVTTVGFVGRSPATTGGEVLSAVLMVVGFVLLAMTTAAVASLFVREQEAPEDERTHEFEGRVLEELRALHERLDRLEQRAAGDGDELRAGRAGG